MVGGTAAGKALPVTVFTGWPFHILSDQEADVFFKLCPSDHICYPGHGINLPKQCHSWETNVYIQELVGDISHPESSSFVISGG